MSDHDWAGYSLGPSDPGVGSAVPAERPCFAHSDPAWLPWSQGNLVGQTVDQEVGDLISHSKTPKCIMVKSGDMAEVYPTQTRPPQSQAGPWWAAAQGDPH